jgi:hypothetical protein
MIFTKENVADAHWLALKRLQEIPHTVGGQVISILKYDMYKMILLISFAGLFHYKWRSKTILGNDTLCMG